jgi:transposase
MRYSASEKLEIIELVEQSTLSVGRTLASIGIPRSTFYDWYGRYQDGGIEALEDGKPRPQRVWNKIPDEIGAAIVNLLMSRICRRARKVDVVVVYKVDRIARRFCQAGRAVGARRLVCGGYPTVQHHDLDGASDVECPAVICTIRAGAGERIRDKFAASRRKGMWMGGTIPLGYDVSGRKLVINAEEADRVRVIFEQYLALGCVSKLREDLEQRGIRSKQRVLASGRVLRGGSFGRGALYHLLQSRIYLGEFVLHKQLSPFQRNDLEIVDRRMSVGFGYFRFQGAMPSF